MIIFKEIFRRTRHLLLEVEKEHVRCLPLLAGRMDVARTGVHWGSFGGAERQPGVSAFIYYYVVHS